MAKVDDHQYRPKFKNAFPSVESVADMVKEAEMELTGAPDTTPRTKQGRKLSETKIDPKTRHQHEDGEAWEYFERNRLLFCEKNDIDPDFQPLPEIGAYSEK